MTWGEFKESVDETEGITDSMEIWYIDVSYPEKEHLAVTPQSEGTENSSGISIS